MALDLSKYVALAKEAPAVIELATEIVAELRSADTDVDKAAKIAADIDKFVQEVKADLEPSPA